MSNFLPNTPEAQKRRRNTLKVLGGAAAAAVLGLSNLLPTPSIAQSTEIACTGWESVAVQPGDTLTDVIREHSTNSETDQQLTGEQAFLVAYTMRHTLRSNDVRPDIMEVSSADVPIHNSARLPGLIVGEQIAVPDDCRVIVDA